MNIISYINNDIYNIIIISITELIL